MLLPLALAFAAAFPSLLSAAPTSNSPRVHTPLGTVVGLTSSDGTIEDFRGIPYGQAPVGNLRFAAPLKATQNYGILDATNHGYACPQMNIVAGALNLPPSIGNFLDGAFEALISTPAFSPIASANASEDCLNLNIQRPAGIDSSAKLPVMIWMFPGAFLWGSGNPYGGAPIIGRSVDMGSPVIFVSPNSRINSFGFLPGQEVADDATASVNAGLLDQRLAMRWVQDNIEAFGGDPARVTLYGESSGAISIGFHLIANGGDHEGLFSAAILQSGGPLPVEGPARGQKTFDKLAKFCGCYGMPDALACLRRVPYERFLAATNSLPGALSYEGLSLSFVPRTDGKFLTQQASVAFSNNQYAKIPLISGNQYDEGTVLTLGSFNVTTTPELDSFLANNFFPNTTSNMRATLLQLYPEDPTQGSPFDTGYLNIITPQNKRISAMLGDAIFQAPRREFLAFARNTQPVWSYASRVLTDLPILGTFHASDILNVFGLVPDEATKEIMSRWIAFANNLDPNVEGYTYWPKYGDDAEDGTSTLLQFHPFGSMLIPDTYRQAAIHYWSTIVTYLAI